MRSLPSDEHGLSKYVIARYLEELARQVGPRSAELRLFGVFGRHEDYAIRFISNAICKALFDLPITLRQNRTFSYLYVDDLGPIVEHFLINATTSARSMSSLTGPTTCWLLPQRSGGAARPIPLKVADARRRPSVLGEQPAASRSAMPDVQFTPTDSAVDALYSWYEANISDDRPGNACSWTSREAQANAHDGRELHLRLPC